MKLTLNTRVTVLMSATSLLLIAVFTLIQLKNEQDNIVRFNSYRAKLSSIIVKNNLENILRQNDPEQLNKILQTAIDVLVEKNIVQDAYIFNTNGIILAASRNKMAGKSVNYRDLNKLMELDEITDPETFSLPQINRPKQELYMYLALKKNRTGAIEYVTRISFSLGNIPAAIAGVYRPIIFSTCMIILANILLSYVLYKTLIGPLKILNAVTKIIAQGDLSVRTKISTGDELEELGSTFNYMTEQLIIMKDRAENANPLTKLPGNIVIREQVEKRIKDNYKFTVIYCDINKFKAFNDKYGIAKGDEVIKFFADITKEAIRTYGNTDDFVGHEGGDDFILITSLDKAEPVADAIIKEFDKRIVTFYDPKDLDRGYIISHARDGSIARFPIMSVSLAGVTNAHRPLAGYVEVTNIAAEMKRKVKAEDVSTFAVDQRREDQSSH